jgi:hypothetical protein
MKAANPLTAPATTATCLLCAPGRTIVAGCWLLGLQRQGAERLHLFASDDVGRPIAISAGQAGTDESAPTFAPGCLG